MRRRVVLCALAASAELLLASCNLLARSVPCVSDDNCPAGERCTEAKQCAPRAMIDAGAPSPHDAGFVNDAGALDDAGAVADAGNVSDAGVSDAGASDAGASDAGPSDAGAGDAGPSGPEAFVVDTDADCADADPGDGTCDCGGGTQCSLRAAVEEIGAGAAGQGTISLPLSVTLTAPIVISGRIEIDAASVGLEIDGADATALFVVLTESDALSLVGPSGGVLSLTRGRALVGGAVFVDSGGTLFASNTEFVSNVALDSAGSGPAFGAAIAVGNGSLILTRDTFFLNAVQGGSGAAIAMLSQRSASLTMSDSLIVDNSATGGQHPCSAAAIYLGGALDNVFIERTLIEQNTTDNIGGAIDVECGATGTAHFVNDTFTLNQANRGGTFFVCDGGLLDVQFSTLVDEAPTIIERQSATNPLQLYGSIVEPPVGASDACGDASCLDDRGENISTLSGPFCPFVGPAGDVFTSTQEVNLGPLQLNGGQTDSYEPIAPSIAIDHIPLDAGPIPFDDQRGSPRPLGNGVDVGAVEQ